MAQRMTLERHKLFEAIAFFTQNTKRCGLVKLFKLLYYLDMLHFRETGRPVTWLAYTALPYGPVPTTLYDEVRQPPPDMAKAISIKSPPPTDPQNAENASTTIKVTSDLSGFLTKRELKIAGEIAEIFRDVSAKQISDISHAKNGPWDLAKKRGQGKWNQLISYFDSKNLTMGTGKPIEEELLKARFREFEEHREFFK